MRPQRQSFRQVFLQFCRAGPFASVKWQVLRKLIRASLRCPLSKTHRYSPSSAIGSGHFPTVISPGLILINFAAGEVPDTWSTGCNDVCPGRFTNLHKFEHQFGHVGLIRPQCNRLFAPTTSRVSRGKDYRKATLPDEHSGL